MKFTQAWLATLFASTCMIGLHELAGAQTSTTASCRNGLTRSVVIADFEIWRESGLAWLDQGEGNSNLFSAAREKAQARYEQARSSPEFVARVQEIARRRGERAEGLCIPATKVTSKEAGNTRAEVRAELLRAIAAGELNASNDDLRFVRGIAASPPIEVGPVSPSKALESRRDNIEYWQKRSHTW